jgi:hypothetical protein
MVDMLNVDMPMAGMGNAWDELRSNWREVVRMGQVHVLNTGNNYKK